MSLPLEITANALSAVCILLAGRNSVHTWWTGILGCLCFAGLFYGAKLYADVTLQGFFIVTGVIGWWKWRAQQGARPNLPVRHAPRALLGLGLLAAALVSVGYGSLLHAYTDAFAPFWDSALLAFSVLGQLLLMDRRVESWWCWLLVNSISVPLYAARGLTLTALLYAGFWLNALISLRHFRELAKAELRRGQEEAESERRRTRTQGEPRPAA